MKVLVLGANGLIGSTVLRVLSESSNFETIGTVRSESYVPLLSFVSPKNLLVNTDVTDFMSLLRSFSESRPNVVINCVGATKHKKEGNSPLTAIELNALFPHRLAQICDLVGSRLIHISSDCVFSGSKGNYTESDCPDASDIYGKSKSLGEVSYGDFMTIRTSTIGHELNTNYGLLNWFLSQEHKCKGFKNAIFSGLPTVTLAKIIKDYVLDNENLKGLYHIAASPINKYELLKLIAKIYGKKIELQVDEDFVIDRSLDATKFNLETGYKPPDWDYLIEEMHAYQ